MESNITLTIETILFGYSDTNNIIDLIILVAKRHIYYSKINKNTPSLIVFKSLLSLQYKTERKIAFQNDTYDTFIQKWQTLTNILETGNT